MYLATDWKDYEVIDTGEGEKLERWGDIILARPDPQVIWPKRDTGRWRSAHARYQRSERGGGEWRFFRDLPESWKIQYKEAGFYVRPTGFKHTGLFPEQAVNWDFMADLIRRRTAAEAGNPVRVLNLFGYTGGASIMCALAGARVTHVDAAKGMVAWGRENMSLSGVYDSPVRWIVDDALKFVMREIRRGNRYEAVLMDPPSYGRGPDGEVWKLEDALFGLVEKCVPLLSDRPLFMLINSYTTGLQASVLSNIIDMTVGERFGGVIEANEVALPVTSGGVLPCGSSGRWIGAGYEGG